MSEFHVLISRWWRGEWDDESRTERDAHKMETVHLIGFFFSLFPPPRSIRWTVFLIVDRGNFHEVISLFSDRSDLCVYTLINLPDERVVNVVQSTKHRSRTSNSFQYWINGYILPTVCHQATTKRTKEKKKKKEAIIISASAVAHSLKKGKNKKGKKKSRPGRLFGSAWPRQHWLSHDHTGARSATPRLWTSNRISYWLGDRLFLL